MIGSKSNYRTSLLMLVIVAMTNQGCAEVVPGTAPLVPPTAPVTFTATDVPAATQTPIPTSALTITPTPVPPGVFVPFFYPPLIMNYDPSIWEDKSNYSEWGTDRNPVPGTNIRNYLEAFNFEICQVGVVGGSGFFPSPEEIVQLGDVRYQFSTFINEHFGAKVGHYIEDQSLENYNYDRDGLPVLEIAAMPHEWEECKALGEEVLSTLHIP